MINTVTSIRRFKCVRFARIFQHNYLLAEQSDNERLGTFVHEFGHAFGLSDYGVIYNGSVMDNKRDCKTVYAPTSTDIANAIEC